MLRRPRLPTGDTAAPRSVAGGGRGAIGIAALEAADVLLEPLGAPAWIQRALVVAFVLGLPVALGLAWALEWTGEGIRRTPGAAHPEPGSRRIAALVPLRRMRAEHHPSFVWMPSRLRLDPKLVADPRITTIFREAGLPVLPAVERVRS